MHMPAFQFVILLLGFRSAKSLTGKGCARNPLLIFIGRIFRVIAQKTLRNEFLRGANPYK